MASVNTRIHDLVEKQLGITDHTLLTKKSSELGINSMVAVAFLKKVNEEFNLDISPSETTKFHSLQEFVDHIKTVID